MGTIYLVRHGQAPAHAYGVGTAEVDAAGLTDLGEAQARRTGELLSGYARFDAAISGDLPRQRATLSGVLAAFAPEQRPEHVVDADWDEYDLPPGLTATDPTLYADRAAYQRILDEGLGRWIGGLDADESAESFAAFAARTRAAADRAADLAGSGRSVLVVSSAGTITQLVAQLWGVPAENWPTLSRTFVNASVTKIIAGRRGLTVVSVNEHEHLAAVDGLMSFR